MRSLVTRRQNERNLTKRVPVTITMDRELYEWIDEMVERGIFKDRTHGVNAALDYLKWTIMNKPMEYFGPRKD